MNVECKKMEENLLIEKASKGNQEAFRQLYEKYKRSLFVVCLRYASGRVEAEDFLQESFINIYKGLKQFDPSRGIFEFWARRITINVCLEKIRKQSLFTVSLGGHDTEEVSPDALSDLSLKELLELINELPFGYKTVFNMYVIDGYSHKEIASHLNISVNTSKTQLMKARQNLKSAFIKKNNVVKVSHG